MSTWWNALSEKAHAKGVKEGRAESSRRIKDLEAEVKRLNSFIRDVAKTGGAAQEKALISVWNDAIEAAASVCESKSGTPMDVREPDCYTALGYELAAEDIRALKRT